MTCAVSLNGSLREIPVASSVADLLAELRLPASLVAVEVNASLVPRELHGARRLVAGDRVEIVTLMGGG